MYTSNLSLQNEVIDMVGVHVAYKDASNMAASACVPTANSAVHSSIEYKTIQPQLALTAYHMYAVIDLPHCLAHGYICHRV
jgi:hypothetical protein